ncbi:hypothetical protein CAPTEDRAFT_228638 [Capitella teleta]|uniref:Uncharacterized protein n=1 Tax=Capitella teleta TaxID=283909 RepID=R7V3N6_CAPTE|nr:hypothetical protein CAPTEDRAFT_228638 [Capitella teleta]|eukprot:ELU13463.1 hypothetical protein CAPTEDRAFT_228638 [Capitella teleta]
MSDISPESIRDTRYMWKQQHTACVSADRPLPPRYLPPSPCADESSLPMPLPLFPLLLIAFDASFDAQGASVLRKTTLGLFGHNEMQMRCINKWPGCSGDEGLFMLAECILGLGIKGVSPNVRCKYGEVPQHGGMIGEVPASIGEWVKSTFAAQTPRGLLCIQNGGPFSIWSSLAGDDPVKAKHIHFGISAVKRSLRPVYIEDYLAGRGLRLFIEGIEANTDRYKYETGGLRIRNIGLQDNGTYECRAEVTSQGHLKVKFITLDVLYAPVISRQPDTSNIIKDRRATLHCEAHGNPPVAYEWFKEQKATESGWARAKVRVGKDSPDYEIDRVEADDEGRYFCRVSNELGFKEVYVDVQMLVPAEVQPLSHWVAQERGQVVMTCEYLGNPEPKVTWLRVKDEREFIQGIQMFDARITVDMSQPGKSKLMIHELSKTDSGQYICTAENNVGTDEKVGTLTVEYPPTVLSNSTEEIGWPGQTRTLTCEGTGRPLPTMNWFHGGQFVSDSDTYNIRTTPQENSLISVLTITIVKGQPWVYGTYACTAKNQYSMAKHESTLTEAEPPGMPSNVSVQSETPTSAELSADLPSSSGGMPVTAWLVEYEAVRKELQLRDGLTSNSFALGEKLFIPGLRPGTAYNFYLSAENAVGIGKSVKFRVKTPRRDTIIEQADVPLQYDEENTTDAMSIAQQNELLRKGGLSDKHPPPSGVIERSSPPPEGFPMPVVIGASAAAALLLVIIMIVLIVLRRRIVRDQEAMKNPYGFAKRRQMQGSDSGGGMVIMNEAKDIDNIQLEIRRHDGSLPDLVHNKVDMKSPPEVRKIASPLPMRPDENTAQRMAWDQMLHHALTSDDELEEEEDEPMDTSPVMELPPPPDFLLEQNRGLEDDSYQDILDGYHSGDNVEDEDKFQIRIAPFRS